MGKHWVRQQVRRNELQDTVDMVLLWVSRNRQTAAAGAGALAAALLIAGFIVYRSRTLAEAAWSRLGEAQEHAYGGRPDQSLLRLKELFTDYGRTKASAFGLLFQGDMMYPRGQYKEALESYSKVLERGEPKVLQPVATADIAVTQEAAGNCPEAASTAQRFLDSYADHFLAPQVHASLARCLEALGKGDQAKAAWQKIVLQYPDTSWASWAQKRLSPPQKKT